jgi:hypothetical protein
MSLLPVTKVTFSSVCVCVRARARARASKDV